MPSRRRNAPSVPASLHRSASASNRRFSLPENLRRLAIATTSGSRRAASGETVSAVALRAPSATASPEEPDNPFKEDLNNEVMCMSYLYSKLPETGVPLLIGTGGGGDCNCGTPWYVDLRAAPPAAGRSPCASTSTRQRVRFARTRRSRCVTCLWRPPPQPAVLQ